MKKLKALSLGIILFLAMYSNIASAQPNINQGNGCAMVKNLSPCPITVRWQWEDVNGILWPISAVTLIPAGGGLNAYAPAAPNYLYHNLHVYLIGVNGFAVGATTVVDFINVNSVPAWVTAASGCSDGGSLFQSNGPTTWPTLSGLVAWYKN